MNKELIIPPAPLNLSREQMPQIAQEHIPEFIDELKKEGIKIRNTVVPVKNLKPTQSEFNHDKIRGMMNNPKANKPILISSDGYVLDGHHTWLSKLNKDFSSKVQCFIIGLKINDLIHRATLFDKSFHKTVHEERTKTVRNLVKEHYTKI